jgi:hypothetical protein
MADDFFAPSELEPSGIPTPPPWVQQPESKPETQENVPPPPPGPPPGFWGEEEDDEEPEPPSFGGFGSSPSNEKPKNSFQLVEPWNDPLQERPPTDCLGWGHPFLGVNVYDRQPFCQFQLEQKIETSRQTIRALEDHTRSLILREAIKGNVTREQTKDVELQYDQLLDTLIMARVSGCKCLQ